MNIPARRRLGDVFDYFLFTLYYFIPRVMVSNPLPAFTCRNVDTQRNTHTPHTHTHTLSLSPEKSMSLLTSIFGGTGQERQQRAGSSSTVKDDGGAYDLFGPKEVVDADDAAMAVPPVVRKSRSKSAAGKSMVIEATTTTGGEGANDVELTDAEDVGRIATSKGGETNMVGEGEGEGEMTIDEKTTKVAAGARNKSREEEDEEDEKSRTVFVGNLPPDISRRALANMFKACGIVSSSRLRSLAVTGVKLPPEQAGNQVRGGGGDMSRC